MTHVRRGATLAAIVVFVSLLSGCESEKARPNAPPTINMKLGQANFRIEVANDNDTREFGLMKRDSMGPDHGMIFVFPDEKPRAFWMKNTRFNLDIAFIDHTGTVVSIKQMRAYDLTSVPSDAPAKYAIELNLGTAQTVGLKVGDHVNIPPEAREPKE
jgi:uncharacterized membrane protein (UPF0127 family)